MIRMVIFDFDGVLVESVDVKTQAFAKLFESEGPEIVEKVVSYHLANGGMSRYEKFRYFYEHLLRLPLSDEKLEELGRRFSDLVVSGVVQASWVRGAKEFLERHHAALDLYVVTGTPHEEIAEIVRRRRMERFFKGIFGTPPEKEELVCTVVRNAGFERDEIALVGDSPQDLSGAKAADIRFIGRVDSPDSVLNKYADITKIPDLRNLRDVLAL